MRLVMRREGKAVGSKSSQRVTLLAGAAVSGIALLSMPAVAAYSMELVRLDVSGDLLPGETFTLGVVLESTTGFDRHNSAIFWLGLSEPGLVLNHYEWSVPYTTGGPLDQSTAALLDGPLEITSGTYLRPGDTQGLIDIEFSNVLLGGSFDNGTLLTAEFLVPETFKPGTLGLWTEIDTIADGFEELGVFAGPGLEIVIIPSPSLLAPALVSIAAAGGRRRRHP